MILCQCAGVTDATVKEVIKQGASNVAAVTLRCGAGRSCPPCRAYIALMIAALRSSTPASDRSARCHEIAA